MRGGDARQDGALIAAARAVGQKGNKGEGGEGSGKRPGGEGDRPGAKAQHHNRYRAGGGPGGDAEDVGLREGVLQQALQHGAADSEAGAAAGGDQRAAEAEIPDNALGDTIERHRG